MSRWPAPGRCKKRLAKKIGAINAASIQFKSLKHTLAVTQILEQKGLAEIQLAISGVASKAATRWAQQEGINKVSNQGKGCLGLRLRKQIIRAQANKNNKGMKRTTILIGTDLPTLSQVDLIQAMETLKTHEIHFN